MLGKIEARRRRGQQRTRWLDGITDLGDGEGQRILVAVHWTARRSNQSILKEIIPVYSFIGRTDAEAPIL